MKEVYIPKSKTEKAMQRALLQFRDPKKYALVHAALTQAGRTDLIGFGPKCLIRPKGKGRTEGFKKGISNKSLEKSNNIKKSVKRKKR